MIKGTSKKLNATEINELINNMLFSINPGSEFNALLEQIEAMERNEKSKAVEVLYKRINCDINNLSSIASMSGMYFGKLERTLSADWLFASRSEDKLIKRRFITLEKYFKIKVQMLIDHEVGKLSEEAMDYGDFCAYERYIFTREYTSSFGLRRITDPDERYKASIEALLRFYGLKTIRAKDSCELHEIITALQAINYARILKVPDDSKKGRLVFVNIFDGFLESLIDKKYSEFYDDECNLCETTENKISLIDKYPIIKKLTGSLIDKYEKLLK